MYDFHIEYQAHEWTNYEGTYIRGWAFTEEGDLLTGTVFAKAIHSRNEVESTLSQFIRSLNGQFSILTASSQGIFLAVDRLRSIPLFYTVQNARLIVSDSGSWVRQRLPPEVISKISAAEFLAVGYVTGSDTLYPSLQQLEAGQYLFWNPQRGLKQHFYYRHLHERFRSSSVSELFRFQQNIDARITERLLRSIGDRPILIPLSGGYDSRYIACLLKAVKRKNVFCYTYGRPDSGEVIRAHRVANRLGFPIHFINYSDDKWEHYFRSDDVLSYYSKAFNCTSLPHIQEYIALFELKQHNKLDSDSIVIPGFCGDLLGGSYVPEEVPAGKVTTLLSEGLPSYLFRRHFSAYTPFQTPEVISSIHERLARTLEQSDVSDVESFVSLNEEWFTRHKVAKFVVNSVRVYEHFGLNWRMPLWDNELTEFWYRVPLDKRVGNSHYNRYLFEHYFKRFSVAFSKPCDTNSVRLRRAVWKRFPGVHQIAKRAIRAVRNANSDVPLYNGFDALERLLAAQLTPLGVRVVSPDINHHFSTWFLNRFAAF